MTIALPSEADEWVNEWKNNLNESEEYTEAGAGWGTTFNGSFLFEIEPDDAYHGDPIHLYVDLEDGECMEAELIEDPSNTDWGFAYRGTYTNWKRLIHGEIGAMDGMMDGIFDLDGDMQKVLQYSDAAIVMTENASTIDTEFEY